MEENTPLPGKEGDTRIPSHASDSETLLRVWGGVTTDGVAFIDGDGVIKGHNKPLERLFGYTDEEIQGKNLASILCISTESHGPLGFLGWLDSHAPEPESGGLEVQAKHQDGTQLDIAFSAARIPFSGKVRYACLLRDITQEKAVRALAESYAHQIGKKNESLARALVAAHSAAQAKTDFLAMMSHEVRTPMNGIIGMTHILLESDLDLHQREIAETIRNCSDGLLSIINDILDFSKIDAGKLDLEMIDFDIRTAVEETVNLLAPKAAEKGVELACLFHHRLPCMVRGDPGRIRQVLLNYLSNAIKFTSAGDILVSVMLDDRSDSDASLHFEVKDTGIGIPNDRLNRLFKPFSQTDASISRRFGGTGLGLAICKRLAELMGGEVGVESEEGSGSTFWFNAVVGLSKENDTLPSVEGLTGIKVLVIDQSPTYQRVLRYYLQTWQCIFEVASSGKQALEMILEHDQAGNPFNVVLVELLLSDMTGEELGRNVGRLKLDHIPALIMIANWGKPGDAQVMRAAGFTGYLTKPVRHCHLKECLSTLIGLDKASSGNKENWPFVTRFTLAENERRRSARILLAEDNNVNQRIAARMLDKLGYRCDIASNGFEVLEAVRESPYDLILMDCQMPGMDGFEATEKLREQESATSSKRLPIVAMTASSMDGDRRRCLRIGMDDFLSKPISLVELGAALEKWIHSSPHPPQQPDSSCTPTKAASTTAIRH
jgi:two-component system, sensor histidine kinase and response regulator